MSMTPAAIAIRAVKTFLQTFTSLLGLDGLGWLNAQTSKQLLAAGVAAGLSAITNALTDLEGRYTNG